MTSLSRLFIRDRETPSSRVRIRHETSLPVDADGANGDVCIVADGDSAGVYVHTGGAWTEIGAGSAASDAPGHYHPEAAPSSPNALDLEFNSAADVSGMTSWNPGSLAGFSATASLSNLVLRTTPQAAGTVRFAGVFTLAPVTASWSAWTKVTFNSYPGGAVGWPCGAGIIAVDGDLAANPTTADFYCARINTQRDAADSQVIVASHSSYTNGGSNLYAQTIDRQTSDAWFRVRYKSAGTTLHFDYSRDGCGWKQLYQTATPSPVPTTVGLVIVSAAGATDPIPAARFDFLRFSETADVFDDTPGRVI